MFKLRLGWYAGVCPLTLPKLGLELSSISSIIISFDETNASDSNQVSTALAGAVVLSAFHQRANFYSAMVYLAQSNFCLLVREPWNLCRGKLMCVC